MAQHEKVLKFTGHTFMICYRLCRYVWFLAVVLVILVQEPLHVWSPEQGPPGHLEKDSCQEEEEDAREAGVGEVAGGSADLLQ